MSAKLRSKRPFTGTWNSNRYWSGVWESAADSELPLEDVQKIKFSFQSFRQHVMNMPSGYLCFTAAMPAAHQGKE